VFDRFAKRKAPYDDDESEPGVAESTAHE